MGNEDMEMGEGQGRWPRASKEGPGVGSISREGVGSSILGTVCMKSPWPPQQEWPTQICT